MPKAALFSTHFLPYSQTFIYEELRHHQRWEMEVFCAHRENPERFPYSPVHVAGPLYPLSRFSPLFERLFKRNSYQLIHAHFGPGSIYALRYAQRFKLPLISTFHGYDVPLMKSARRLLPEWWRYGWMAPRLLSRLTLALCASTELREMIIENGVPEERARVWRLGIDLEAFKPGPKPEAGPLQLLMIGRFVEKKGYPVALRAFAQRVRAGDDLELSLIGGGDGEQGLRALVKRLGMEERVHFLGVLSSEQVAQRLRSAHLLLCPSVTASDGDRESGLIVAKEASACGTVPLGTWHGGLPEIIADGETGFLLPERDAEGLADRLGRLVADPALRQRMAKAARAKMEAEYNIDDRLRALEELYDEAVDLYRG